LINNSPKNINRLASLDILRGFAIAGMILVNFQSGFEDIYYQLRHAGWNGCTVADLVFPFFLFIVGVVIPFSFMNRSKQGHNETKLFLHIIKRTIIIFSLGLIINGFPHFSLSTLRIPGVLQRIALCYFFASITVIKMQIRGQAVVAATLLILYWILMKLVPVPGYGAGVLSIEGNLAAYIDNLLLHGHLLEPTWDPEGILSTIPAVSTTLLGVLTGHLMISSKTPKRKLLSILVLSCLYVITGLIIDIWFPINKWLWSSSYAVFSAGIACGSLGLCYWLVDLKGYYRWSIPFVIYGTNSIMIYVFSSIFDRFTHVWKINLMNGSEIKLKTYIFEKYFATWSSSVNASLFYSLTCVIIFFGIMSIFYRKKIIIKI
jgi:predicted acyltransferase